MTLAEGIEQERLKGKVIYRTKNSQKVKAQSKGITVFTEELDEIQQV